MRRLVLALLVFVPLIAKGDDWPQWLGPNHDGLSPEMGLLPEWPEGGPKQVWLTRECGLGYSGPAVVGDRLYVMGLRDGAEKLLALDAQTGEELWATDLGEPFTNNWGDGPRSTPTVDGDTVYCMAARGDLVAVKAADGLVAWRKSMVDDLGGAVPAWGYAESPLVDEGRVVVTPGGKEGSIVALGKATGETLWRCADLADGAHYSSVVPFAPHGKRQYTQLLEKRLVGLDAATGKLLWEAEWPGSVAVIPTPIVSGDTVYVTSGYGAGSMLVRVDADNKAEVVYKNEVMKNHHGGVLLLEGKLYGHSDGVGWLCQDLATGERVWRERSELGKGAVAYADGRLYCLSEDEGEVALVEPSDKGWREHGRFTLAPQTEQRKPKGRIWVHPVIANGRLYLRDQELLFSFDVKE